MQIIKMSKENLQNNDQIRSSVAIKNISYVKARC